MAGLLETQDAPTISAISDRLIRESVPVQLFGSSLGYAPDDVMGVLVETVVPRLDQVPAMGDSELMWYDDGVHGRRRTQAGASTTFSLVPIRSWDGGNPLVAFQGSLPIFEAERLHLEFIERLNGSQITVPSPFAVLRVCLRSHVCSTGIRVQTEQASRARVPALMPWTAYARRPIGDPTQIEVMWTYPSPADESNALTAAGSASSAALDTLTEATGFLVEVIRLSSIQQPVLDPSTAFVGARRTVLERDSVLWGESSIPAVRGSPSRPGSSAGSSSSRMLPEST